MKITDQLHSEKNIRNTDYTNNPQLKQTRNKMKKERMDYHLNKIKETQQDLNDRHQQALTNLDAMHQECGGEYDDKGNFIFNRNSAILWFANDKHKVNYATPDPF